MDTRSDSYKGWSLFDKVVLVIKDTEKYMGYNQAYVVNPSNKKSLEAARKWATTGYTDRESGEYKYKKGKEVELENRDFKITLYSSAGKSYSQGGKLSFWNCLIEKGEHKYIIGINADLLLKLLLQSKCINGVIEEKVMFARNNAAIGLLHDGMKEYTEAINDIKLKQRTAKKTSKHVIGTYYNSLTSSNLYLGTVYNWVNIQKEKRNTQGYTDYKPDIVHINFMDTPERLELFISESNIKYFTELNDSDKEQIKSSKEFFNQLVKIDKVHLLSSWVVKKAPARSIGKILFSDYTDGLKQELIENFREKFIQSLEKQSMWFMDDSIKYILGLSEFCDKTPQFSEEQRNRIVNGLCNNIYINFGDGIVYRGTKANR